MFQPDGFSIKGPFMYLFVANIYYYDVIQDLSHSCDKNDQGKTNHMDLNLIFMLPRAVSPLWLFF